MGKGRVPVGRPDPWLDDIKTGRAVRKEPGGGPAGGRGKKRKAKRKPAKAAKEPDLPPVAGADYLSRHGISCEMIEVAPHEEGVAAALQAEAATRKAGLLVMGAYGHTRLTERVFGGVTRRMLTGVRIPLLLTH